MNCYYCYQSYCIYLLLVYFAIKTYQNCLGNTPSQEEEHQARPLVRSAEQRLRPSLRCQAFSALKESGNVISWGNESDGGRPRNLCGCGVSRGIMWADAAVNNLATWGGAAADSDSEIRDSPNWKGLGSVKHCKYLLLLNSVSHCEGTRISCRTFGDCCCKEVLSWSLSFQMPI